MNVLLIINASFFTKLELLGVAKDYVYGEINVPGCDTANLLCYSVKILASGVVAHEVHLEARIIYAESLHTRAGVEQRNFAELPTVHVANTVYRGNLRHDGFGDV
ncbi:hypothetical protein HMPREF0293_1026 [Corynebacterium glucuronolyticum ATCC 51866]|uniref:Uncharacterized protein n=1 Tax=Corynebacterium glucuronolyticum ATCC 51866 TaxID=548478 RepID=A0ABP2DU26_9CORY|nr:hypothetical protein HMPREF0293_1026 [Corynebacterium glucuronolyticum ATCC 51866]